MIFFLAAIFLLSVLVALLLRELGKQREQFDAERVRWESERSQLVTRIQHPKFIPASDSEAPPDEELLTHESDEYDLVGVIQTGRDDGD